MAIDSDRVAVAGGAGVDGIDPALALWGRLVRVEAVIGINNSDVHALRPERSAVRTRLRRFRPVRDAAVRVLKLDEAVFWVDVVGDIDRDAYLVFESAEAGPARVTTSQLRHESAETPFVIQALSAASFAGLVQGAHEDNVASATVDLLQPLAVEARKGEDIGPDTPLVVVATTTSGADGSFVFDRVTQPPFLVMASSPFGRGSAVVDAIGLPVVVRLAPAARAHGRVLWSHVPVPGARVRFVPAAAEWMSSADPSEQLVEETATGDDGAFSIALPEK
ncbi:MAG TPA: hypothetical protein VEU08_00790, partial [Vicinamibacterales bacterium]|nr:hypothetical protein [Vicinamibacterales bacterium]